MRHALLSTAFICLLSLTSSAQTSMRNGTQLLKQPVSGTHSSRLDTTSPGTTSERPASVTPPAQAKRRTKVAETKTTTTITTTNKTRKTAVIPASTPRGVTNHPARLARALVPKVTVNWMTIEEALEKSKTEKRKIFIDVYTDWCGWCRHMDSTTFSDPAVAAYLNEKYYPVKFNAEQTTEIVYKEKTYKFKKQGDKSGYHELAALLLNNRLTYPTTVVLNEEQDIIQPIPGFQDGKKMDIILHYFGADNHKRVPWEKYERTYSKDQK